MKEQPEQTARDDRITAQIDENLRRIYAIASAEPLPHHLTTLIAALQANTTDKPRK